MAINPFAQEDRPALRARTSRQMLTRSSVRWHNRTQSSSDIFHRDGTRAVAQIPESSKIKDPFQYGIRIREKTILQRACCNVSGVTGDRESVARHRSKSCTDIGSDPVTAFVNVSHHATAITDAVLRAPRCSLFYRISNRVSPNTSLSVSSSHKTFETAFARGTHEILSTLACRRFIIKRHITLLANEVSERVFPHVRQTSIASISQSQAAFDGRR